MSFLLLVSLSNLMWYPYESHLRIGALESYSLSDHRSCLFNTYFLFSLFSLQLIFSECSVRFHLPWFDVTNLTCELTTLRFPFGP